MLNNTHIQPTLFDMPPDSGAMLAREGMERAERHADQVVDQWSTSAYEYLCSFIMLKRRGFTFMTEDVRRLAELSGKVAIPPSKRAWGGVILKACHRKLIRKVGFQQVKNERAHCANASVWQII